MGRCAHSHCATVLGAKRGPEYKLKHFQPVSAPACLVLSQRWLVENISRSLPGVRGVRFELELELEGRTGGYCSGWHAQGGEGSAAEMAVEGGPGGEGERAAVLGGGGGEAVAHSASG